MYPILYDAITIPNVPQHRGLGTLTDCISCVIEQERNGIYEMVLEYPANGIHVNDLAYMRFIKAKPNFTDDPQLFYINRISKAMRGKITVYCRHISYLLSGYDITTGTANNAAAACALLQDSSNGFTITTDKVVSASFKINTPASVKSYFAGREGSFLDVFGTAEIKYNNFNVQFLLHAGTDRGVEIRYGKNMLELSQEIEASNLYTHVRCFYKQPDEDAVTSDRISTGLSLGTRRVLVVDVTSEYDSAPTKATLNTRAQKYIDDNNLTTPTNNIKLNFEQSQQLANRVDLCDTVNVYYPALGITRTGMKCIRTKYDCIREKYIETEFGDAKPSATDTIAAQTTVIEELPSSSMMDYAIAHATELITGNLGGYVILHDANNDGKPDEILIMDKEDIDTATNVWRFNKNGLGHSTSYAGTYGLALTKDGQIVATKITTGTLDCSLIKVQHLSASSIDTGTLNANLIKAGTISDTAGNSSINMTNGVAKMYNFDAKMRFRLLNDSNVVKVLLTHNVGSGSNFTFYNESDVDCGGISSGSNGLQIVVKNGQGSSVVQAANSRYGGEVAIGNGTNQVATLYTGTNGGGLSIANSAGQTVGSFNANSALGCSLALDDSAGTINILHSGDTGNIRCVSLTQTSSRKVKKNIKPISDAYKVLALEAVEFDYKNEALGTDKRGFIAEDVAEILPNLVTPETKTDDIERPATLDYIGMIPYLQAVIKDHQKRIDDLEKRLQALEKRLDALEGGTK